MSRSKNKKSGDDGGDPNAWMATFSDLNFLMITFFVLLLSMSSMDSRRYTDVFGDVVAESNEVLRPEPQMGRGALPGIVPAKGSWVGRPRSTPVADTPGMSGPHNERGTGFQQEAHKAVMPSQRSAQRDKVLRRLMEEARDFMAVEAITDEEIRLAVEDSVFFSDGEYRPTPAGRQVLAVVAGLMRELPGELHIQAHRGSWELAAQQAAEVARLIVAQRVPGPRVSADVIAGPPGVLNFSLVNTRNLRVQEQSNGE